jgi:hypothetical protein
MIKVYKKNKIKINRRIFFHYLNKLMKKICKIKIAYKLYLNFIQNI